MHITYAIEIESPVETVFAWVGDGEKAMAWMKSVTRGEIIQATPEVVGTTFKEYVEEDGKGVEMSGVITRYEPPRAIAFRLESRVNQVEVAYQVEACGEKTRLEITSDVRWKFPINLMSIAFGGQMRRGILAQLAEETNELKRLCEGRRKRGSS